MCSPFIMKNIVVKNLKVEFENKIAIDDLSLDINEGDFVCILGKNGSGKSTFAKTLNCLILPTSGTVNVYGMDTSDESKTLDIRRLVGMAFQNPDNQIVSSIVEEDVAFGLENLGIESTVIRKRIDEAMKTLDIYDIKDNVTSKLSGGQKQRVAIAGILAIQSTIIVLDEPTSMIDKSKRKELLKVLQKLNKENNITIILITHFLEEIVFANRVIFLESGKLVLDEKPNELLLKNDILNKYGFELPYIPRLTTFLKSESFDFKGNELEVKDLLCQYLK